MRDKLEKTGKKKPFYRAKRISRAFAFAAILSFSGAVPVIMVAADSMKEAEAVQAAEAPQDIEDNADDMVEGPETSSWSSEIEK